MNLPMREDDPCKFRHISGQQKREQDMVPLGMSEDDPYKFRHVELEICTACDLSCFGCDRMSDVTTAPNMTIQQVGLFVKESLDLGWRWERIRLLGGEPTLHPKFMEMVYLLIHYRERFPGVFLQVLSNGQGKYKQYKEFCAGNNVSLHCEWKQKGVEPAWFNNTRITPVDRGEGFKECDACDGEGSQMYQMAKEHCVEAGGSKKQDERGFYYVTGDGKEIPFKTIGGNCSVCNGAGRVPAPLPPCSIFGPHGCGLGLTRHGYFLDGAGASIARVVGHDIGVMHLKDVTWEAMQEQAKVLCRICGHWNDPTPGVPPVTKKVTETGLVTGKFWTEALAKYAKEKPKLKVYGEI